MNYKESDDLLKLIEQNNNFILFCHDEPDIDSIFSCLIMAKYLSEKGKKVDIYCQENIDIFNHYLTPEDKIIVAKASDVNYSDYDVFMTLDVNEFRRFGIDNNFKFNGKVINIDHHSGNGFGDISIVDQMAGSTCTIVYNLLKDWNYPIPPEMSERILVGIISDTGVFHYSIKKSPYIFNEISEIMNSGGDYEKALYLVEQFNRVETMHFWAEALQAIQVDKENRFAYTIIPHSTVKKYEGFDIRSRFVADNFLRNIIDTDFGVVIVESEDGGAKLSIRTRTPGFYVLDLVVELGGGGHLTGGGAYVKEDTFDKSVEKVLETARKYAKANMISK